MGFVDDKKKYRISSDSSFNHLVVTVVVDCKFFV